MRKHQKGHKQRRIFCFIQLGRLDTLDPRLITFQFRLGCLVWCQHLPHTQSHGDGKFREEALACNNSGGLKGCEHGHYDRIGFGLVWFFGLKLDRERETQMFTCCASVFLFDFVFRFVDLDVVGWRNKRDRKITDRRWLLFSRKNVRLCLF